MRTGKGT